MSLIWFIIIIGISIFIHELGHYLAARWQKVGVKNFAVGFGPTLIGFTRWGTTWRLNLVPLGGYAEIDGMLPGDTQGYARLAGWGKLFILVGGVVMNLLLAWTLLAWSFSTQGIPNPDPSKAEITRVVPDSLAEKSGFRIGDRILSINGTPIKRFDEVTKFRETTGEKIFLVERATEQVQVKFNWDNSQTRLGIGYGPVVTYTRLNFFAGFGRAITSTVGAVPRFVSGFISSVGRLLTGQQDSGLAGPVGIANAAGEAAQQGATSLIQLLALINVSLAIFNLLPIPGLDGGRILILAANALTRGKITAEQEARLSYGGFLLMILLFVLVTINDIRNLGGG